MQGYYTNKYFNSQIHQYELTHIDSIDDSQLGDNFYRHGGRVRKCREYFRMRKKSKARSHFRCDNGLHQQRSVLGASETKGNPRTAVAVVVDDVKYFVVSCHVLFDFEPDLVAARTETDAIFHLNCVL